MDRNGEMFGVSNLLSRDGYQDDVEFFDWYP
jgi:hypothetical protein